ncbi:MAG: ABC transporter ATP-binding protein [Chlorobiota bacterium]|nr:ABC transporter ATP-binding protein [Chlorobiota bacterium]QQS67457.1 MAG: ABC transporter ATP-binding protein [Chlorobiota bacterium]
MALLKLDNVTMKFGGLTAVGNLTQEIPMNSLYGIIGPNGAGKTTVFNMITGVYKPTEGNVIFNDKSIIGLKPYEIAANGIARTFQNIRLFTSLSVSDNVRVALNNKGVNNLTNSILQFKKYSNQEDKFQIEIDNLLEMFSLLKFKNELAKNLSYGDQRRVEIVRALATNPKLLLLDEPAAGMTPTEKVELMSLIRFLRDNFDLTIVLIEHDMKVVMGVCEQITVIDYGNKIATGTPFEIKSNPIVIQAYLGEVTN